MRANDDDGGLATAFGPSPELIEDITLSNAVIAEGVAGAGAGNLGVVDTEDGGPYAFLVDNPLFEVRLISAEQVPGLYLKPDVALDYETASSHAVTVTATDALGQSFAKAFVISVGDVDETPPPSAIDLSNFRVAENVPGAGVGQVTVIDPDQATGHLLSVDDARFELRGDLLYLREGIALDFETAPDERILITATDADGQSLTETFSIEVVNDPSDDVGDDEDGPPDPGDDIEFVPIFADFETGLADFAFASESDYATGGIAEGAGLSGSAALELVLGGQDDADVEGLEAAFARDFSLAEAGQVTLTFWYDFSQSDAYEAEEVSRLLVRLDGQPPEGELVVELAGGGDTGWVQVSLDLGLVEAGEHSLSIGAENSRKTYHDEETRLLIDDVLVSAEAPAEQAGAAPGAEAFAAPPAPEPLPDDSAAILL